jgi:hypothetical protein
MGMQGCEWVDSRKGKIKYALQLENVEHTHNAAEDARELAIVFEEMLKARKV